ncbi:MAG: ABC transporter ATP-binding protein [Deferribacterales bacterium]
MLKIKVKKELANQVDRFQLDINFEINNNELISLFGKSGSGKTTTLRIIAGLEKPDEGIITVNDKIWFSSKDNIFIPPQKRKVGLVFQSYCLFPNKTVYENIIYGCKTIDKKYIDKLVEMVNIGDLLRRYPHTLSGGQQQRVALIRAIANKPEILLLDEPLSALDASIRVKLQDEIKLIHKDLAVPTIIISHDYQEVLKLADKIYIIDDGKIIKYGTPQSIFLDKQLTPKFSFTGFILDIVKTDVAYITIVAIGENLVQVLATEDDFKNLSVGDKVYVANKGFNPIIKKAEN